MVGRRVLCAALLSVLAAGCVNGHTGVPHPVAGPLARQPFRPVAAAPRTAVRVPRPDYANPASVAAAFFTAWASVDAVHDTLAAFLARCARLVTPALRRQLTTNQPGAAQWELMHREHVISVVRVRAVTHPEGAPAATPTRVSLRVYAVRIVSTPAGRTTVSDGITLQLTRSGGRWLAARILFW